VFHLIQGIGNVDLVELIVYGRTVSSLRLPLTKFNRQLEFLKPAIFTLVIQVAIFWLIFSLL